MDQINFTSNHISKEDYEKAQAWGLSASLNLYGCNNQLITDFNSIQIFLTELCRAIDMEPHGEPLMSKFGEGDLEGYSAIQFIKTSSITIHFDDKGDNRAFIDIFSCKYFDVNATLAFCQKFFAARRASAWSLLRK